MPGKPEANRDNVRSQIIQLHVTELSNREIGRRLGVSEGCVRYTLKKWQAEGRPHTVEGVPVVQDNPRTGRPSKMTPRCFSFSA